MEQMTVERTTAGTESEKAVADHANKRTDQVTAAIVEKGLELLEAHGLEQALEYLSAQMVPLRVAQRVLLNPAERRKTRCKA